MLNDFNFLDKYCFSSTSIFFDGFLLFLSKYLLSVKVLHILDSEHKKHNASYYIQSHHISVFTTVHPIT